MITVAIVPNPLEPQVWERHETDDLRAFLRQQFRVWPAGARIYDLEGVGALDRAVMATDPSILASRDVTPSGTAGPAHDAAVERLSHLRGPVLVTVAPGDPVTAIITVAAVILGVVAGLLLAPRITPAGSQGSPNNMLADRSNKARPNERIPDIYGTVRSIPDLIAQTYRVYINDLEQEIAYMCVGRGSYAISDVRDGDTPLTSIAGAGATFYGPGTSPNSGTPQLTIGTSISDPVFVTTRLDAVNGQVLRPPNANYVRGDGNIRFVAPDTIETNDSDLNFSDFFDTDDVLTIGNANFGGQSAYITVQQSARFYADKTVEFDAFDPSTVFVVGMTVQLANAIFTGVTTGGAPITVDLSGTYVVNAVDSTTIGLT